MEIYDYVVEGLKVGGKNPRSVGDRVALPVDEVFEVLRSSTHLRIEYFFDNVRGTAIFRDDWIRRRVDLSLEVSVWNVSLKKGYMEDIVDPHGGWDVQSVGGLSDLLENLERPEFLEVQLGGGSCSLHKSPE